MLTRLGIALVPPPRPIHEIQTCDLDEAIREKALSASRALGSPCFVDDVALLLDEYPGFPGAITRSCLESLGAKGFAALLDGKSAKAKLSARVACSDGNDCLIWRGDATGTLRPSDSANDGPGPLATWFKPDAPGNHSAMLHRIRAWQNTQRDWDQIVSRGWVGKQNLVPSRYTLDPSICSCIFCREFMDSTNCIYAELADSDPQGRVVYCGTKFLLLPPLGQFVDGGLLLLTRSHVKSMAHCSREDITELEDVVKDVSEVLSANYGIRPVIFEHGPGRDRDKSTCCVDHAHLNIFPVEVDLWPVLERFPGKRIESLSDLTELRDVAEDYIFVQHNDGSRSVHFCEIFPSQFIRREITRQMGFPERWHWRDYLGLEEMRRTYQKLFGKFSAHAAIGF